jgi:hypothetical protein
MRAKEFVNEGKKKKLSKTYRSASTGVDAYVTGSDPYFKYRVGVAAAGAPNFEHDYDADGPTSAHMIANPYSKGDEEIMNAAIKKIGVKKVKVVGRGSMELDGTNTTSPVSNWNKQK